MTKTTPERNEAFVLKAFGTLFNKRDHDAPSRYRPDNTPNPAHASRPGAMARTSSVRT